MGFEAPLALLALAAAGLPIALHLLRRQDLPTRKLPTVALLMRAQTASRRRVRLVDLLLLIVRVLLIAMAALAVARPFVDVTLAYGDGSVASVAIVIDDSMSMAGRGEPSLLARASDRATEVVRSLPEGSEVAVVLAGAPARVLVARTAELDAARRAVLDARGPSARGTDLRGALALAERELAGARHADRRLLVLTDGAAHALADLELPVNLASTIERLEGPTANAAIVDARATPDPTTPGRLSIAVDVRASELDGREIPLVLRRGGEELARTAVVIAEGGARATLHAAVDPADPAAELALEIDDALDMDDTRGLLLRAPSGARIVVVDDQPRGTAPGAEFLSRAIDLAPREGGELTRRRVDRETFAAMGTSEADMIVLSGVAAPSERVAAALREHVTRGGGLLIAPGESFDARAYAARLGDLLPARPRAAVSLEVRGPSAAPGSDLVDGAGLESTMTQRWLTLEEVEPESETPLVFDGGAPALVIGRRGDGRVALLATSLDDAWTDLPYRPGYLPLVVSLLRRLAPAGSAPSGPVLAGTRVTIEPPAGAVRLDVIAPDGERTVFDSLSEPVAFDATDAPGVYRVEVATRERALSAEARLAFLVAPPASESSLSPGELPAGSAGASGAEPASTVVEKPLWPWLFLLVGLLALIEAALRMRAGQLLRRPA